MSLMSELDFAWILEEHLTTADALSLFIFLQLFYCVSGETSYSCSMYFVCKSTKNVYISANK